MNISKWGVLLVLGAIVVPLGGCEDDVDYSKVKYEHNPNPKERYELTATIDGAPGEFNDGYMQAIYTIIDKNGHCLPPRDQWSGALPSSVPTNGYESPALTQSAPNTWKGEFSTDGLLEKAYYGRDVCRWRFDVVELFLMAREPGKKFEKFQLDMNPDEVLSGKPKIGYFRKDRYPGRVDPPLNYSYGQPEAESLKEMDGHIPDFFTMTLTARKIAP